MHRQGTFDLKLDVTESQLFFVRALILLPHIGYIRKHRGIESILFFTPVVRREDKAVISSDVEM